MTDADAALSRADLVPGAATLAASVAARVAAPGAALGRVRPERVEVVLRSDQRRAHAPELRARLVAEMLAGGVVSAVSRREGIGPSVLHRWLRRARAAGALAQASLPRMLPVRLVPPPVAEPSQAAAVLEVVLRNGRVLRVPPGADLLLVGRIAAALE